MLALAADLLLLHARLCPVCITRGAHACELGGALARVLEREPSTNAHR